jgi:Lipocalin-like domain
MDARCFWLLGIIGMALSSNMNVFGQSKRGSLEGVWQAAEVTCSGPAGPTTFKPGPNLTIFAGRHYSRIDIQTEKPRPVLANPANATAEELREVWAPLFAEAGTYELKENLITLQPSVAKNPAAMAPGVSIVYSYNLEGDTLTLTAQRDRSGPVANPFTVKLRRIE